MTKILIAIIFVYMISIDIIYIVISDGYIAVKLLSILKIYSITGGAGLFMVVYSLVADVKFEDIYPDIRFNINREEGNVFIIKFFIIIAWIIFVLSFLFYFLIFDFRVLICHGSLLVTIMLFQIAKKNLILIADNKK